VKPPRAPSTDGPPRSTESAAGPGDRTAGRSMAEAVIVNGRRLQGPSPQARSQAAPDAPISPFERGLHFGDGLFETIACRNRRPRFLRLHLERLALGCQRLRIPPPDPDELRREIRSLAGEAPSAIIKLILTRGVATSRGYAPSGAELPTRITFRYRWPAQDAAAVQDGVAVRTARLRLGENPVLAGLKHLNRLEQVLAKAEFPDTRIAEALLFSRSGNVICGTMTNVFIVRGQAIHTPAVDLCGVAGVMRRVVMQEGARGGLQIRERVLDATDLGEADEVFLTNARIGIWPVRELDGRAIKPGPLTRELQRLLGPLLEEPSDD